MPAQIRPGAWCHVEIPTTKPTEAQRFYGKLFGWKFQPVPEMDYTLYETPKGGIGGGLWTPAAGLPRQVINYVLVKDIAPVLRNIERYGGRTVKPQAEVPGAGWFALVSDPDGNIFGLWKSRPKARRQAKARTTRRTATSVRRRPARQ